MVSPQTILPLKMIDATVSRRAKTLLGPLSLTLSQSGFTVVLGPNGAGKTTLLRALHGLDRLSNGRVVWSTPLDIARKRQSFVFQSPIMMRRSVMETLAFPMKVRGDTRASRDAACAHWLERIGLTHARHRAAPRLSGGEQQKLALARALIIEPEILFLDEPCASLDGASMRDIETILREACDRGTRIVMSTHDLGQARRLADEVLFLHHGHLLEQTSAGQFFDAPETPQAKAFLDGDIVV